MYCAYAVCSDGNKKLRHYFTSFFMYETTRIPVKHGSRPTVYSNKKA